METNVKINEHQYDLSSYFIAYYENVKDKYYFEYNSFSFLLKDEFLDLYIPEYNERQFNKFSDEVNESIKRQLENGNHYNVFNPHFKRVLDFFNEIDETGESIKNDRHMTLMKIYYDLNKCQVIIQYYENKKIIVFWEDKI